MIDRSESFIYFSSETHTTYFLKLIKSLKQKIITKEMSMFISNVSNFEQSLNSPFDSSNIQAVKEIQIDPQSLSSNLSLKDSRLRSMSNLRYTLNGFAPLQHDCPIEKFIVPCTKKKNKYSKRRRVMLKSDLLFAETMTKKIDPNR